MVSNEVRRKELVGYVLEFGFLFFLTFQPAALEGMEVTTTLETRGCNQSLDFRSKKYETQKRKHGINQTCLYEQDLGNKLKRTPWYTA